VLLALSMLLLLAAAAALVTRHQLSYRIHDYAILNLAGQMREMAGSMALDAAQIRGTEAPGLSEREGAAYLERLSRQVAQYDRIVTSFETRQLSPDLTGLDAPVSCNWDAPSLRTLRETAAVWHRMHRSIGPALASPPSAERTLEIAGIVATEGPAVLEASRELSHAFKAMMQAKLDAVIRLQLGVLVATAAVGVAVLAWLRRRVLGPLATVERAAVRLIDGDLTVAPGGCGDREIAAVGTALERLATRLQLLFDVAERTNAGLTTAELLDTLRDTLHAAVPIDLVGVAVRSAIPGEGWRMHRTSGSARGTLADGATLSPDCSVPDLERLLAAAAAAEGFGSVLVVPLRDEPEDASVLLFAATGRDAFPASSRALLRTVAGPVRAQIDRTLSTEALVVAAVEGLAKLAESRDPETGDHLVRMSAYSAMLGAELSSDPSRGAEIDSRYLDDLRRFAPMHDIGKVGVADQILLKPGRLTDEERDAMKRHPVIGGEVLRRCEAQMQARGRSVFRLGIEIAEGHHERWDGAGYPNGLAGEAIPLAARIVAVADVFDALTSKRPYKEAWSFERALETIDADSGRHFDPAVVAALHRRLPEIRAFYERHKHV
jgi:HD-GYP domain-containing protein (c-di-GMP phosphodiesterase class II)